MPVTRNTYPAASAPVHTNEYASCGVCGFEWQVLAKSRDDAKGCSFCDAPASAITIHDEGETAGPAFNSLTGR